jgi:hypothetical protein
MAKTSDTWKNASGAPQALNPAAGVRAPRKAMGRPRDWRRAPRKAMNLSSMLFVLSPDSKTQWVSLGYRQPNKIRFV